jgi:hypothetical protein
MLQNDLGYYYGHQRQRPDDGIAAHEYEMNRPKPLGTGGAVTRVPTKITRYSYEDLPHEVRCCALCGASLI